ncbi:MAG: DUF3006 domain-containing protein [Elusimicrobia bacterium]|nr:DUF3006 domain-containing protein [Elusimicrobiota bacterium]
MKGIIDRIEDGKTAVINIVGGGSMLIPAEQFDIKIHEGQHLKITFEPDEESEQKTREEIKNLQEELLKRNEDQE